MIYSQKSTKKKSQEGQVLLITVMLLATAITVVMAIAFNSTTETQITKLEEGSQKALSAAEAALEAAIQKRANVAIDSLSAFDNSGITGQANIVEVGGNEFVTPLLQRDEQYMFYLADYNDLTFGPGYWRGQIHLYAQSESGACPVLELTLVASDDSLSRYVVDHCANLLTTGSKITSVNTSESDTPGKIVSGITFQYRTEAPELFINSDKKMLIVRVLNASTRLGFKGSSTQGVINWINLKSQGRLISSEAKTQDGITKKIELFQSYPQVPADFFVTSF